MIKILIYEDNQNLREGLTILLGSVEGFEVKGAYKNCKNIIAEVAEHQPELILMDIEMPVVGGLEGLRLVKTNTPEVKVLMLTIFDDNKNVFDALRNGADGYVLKRTPPLKLIEFIKDALEGGAPMTASIARMVLETFKATNPNVEHGLSERENDVLKLLVNGFSYKMVASELFISIDTVRSHIRKIYEKLQVNSKSEAVAKALKNRMV